MNGGNESAIAEIVISGPGNSEVAVVGGGDGGLVRAVFVGFGKNCFVADADVVVIEVFE